MIKRLQVLHYRALKYIDIKLSNFHILVGPNASGKSSFLDVINLIRDILNESPHAAVEKRASRFDELLWNQQGNKFEIAAELEVPKEIKQRLKDKDFSLDHTRAFQVGECLGPNEIDPYGSGRRSISYRLRN